MNKEELIRSRHELLKVLIQKVQNFSGIDGIFLGGSIAAQNEDPFSDIGLRILLKELYSKDKFIHLFIDELSDISFIETEARSYAVIHFNNFIKLDIFVYINCQIKLDN